MTTGTPPILEIRGLRKKFHDVEILRGIDLAVVPQELVFVIGPSGPGKSTLLRCCNRLEGPTPGVITLEGIDPMARSTDNKPMRRKTDMVVQTFNHYQPATALGNRTLALPK